MKRFIAVILLVAIVGCEQRQKGMKGDAGWSDFDVLRDLDKQDAKIFDLEKRVEDLEKSSNK